MCSCRTIVFLAIVASVIAVDSEGTNFVFGFVRNANPDISNQVLTATVINQNSVACSFTLTYRPNYDKRTQSLTSTTALPAASSTTVDIPSWYGFNYTGYGAQDDLYLALRGTATCNVTVLANNYDSVTQQGDTYLVLPTNWGSTSFTFSLPPAVISANTRQYEQIFILPTTSGYTNVAITEIGLSTASISMNITDGDSPAAYIGTKTPDTAPRTYHVVSDKPVLIVAGVTCAGLVESNCDHAVYMPHPQAATDCYSYDYYDDDHISYLPTTSTFFTDIPGSCSTGQYITYTLNDGTSWGMTIKPAMESPLWSVRTTVDTQKGVSFHNGGSNIHIARYYDGSKYSSSGTLIATSPSVTQFHTDYTPFHTRNANDSVEVYCTVVACAYLQLDGVYIYDHNQNPTIQKVDDDTYYIFYITVPQAGYHQLYIDPSRKGVYAFFVFGKNGQYSYGYEGGVNKPTVVLAPQVSTTPGTVTSKASTVTSPITTPITPLTSQTPITSNPSTSTMLPSPSSSLPTLSSTTSFASTSTQTPTTGIQTTATTGIPTSQNPITPTNPLPTTSGLATTTAALPQTTSTANQLSTSNIPTTGNPSTQNSPTPTIAISTTTGVLITTAQSQTSLTPIQSTSTANPTAGSSTSQYPPSPTNPLTTTTILASTSTYPQTSLTPIQFTSTASPTAGSSTSSSPTNPPTTATRLATTQTSFTPSQSTATLNPSTAETTTQTTTVPASSAAPVTTAAPPVTTAGPITAAPPASSAAPITTVAPVTTPAPITAVPVTTAAPITTASPSAAPVTVPVQTTTAAPVTGVPVTSAVPITAAPTTTTTTAPAPTSTTTTVTRQITTTTPQPTNPPTTTTTAAPTTPTTPSTTKTTTTAPTTTTSPTTTYYTTTQSSTQATLYLSFILSIFIVFY